MADARRVARRIGGNLGRLLGGKAAAGLLSLAYMVLAARALGREDYGVLILAHTYVTAIAGIIEFPGWHAVVSYGARAAAEEDWARLSRLTVFAGSVEIACGALAVAAAAALAPLVGPRLGWSPQAVAFALPYSFAALGTVRATPAGYLQLIGRFDLLGWHNMVAPLVRLVGAGVCVLARTGLHGFLVAWLVAALAEWAVMWALGAWAARKRLSPPALRNLSATVVQENPGLWRFMWGANLDVTLAELGGRLTPLAIGALLGPGATALYAVAQRATAILAQPAQILGQAAYAELAHLVASGDQGPGVRAVLRRAAGAALLAAAPICLGIALFGDRLAVLVGGDGFAGAGAIMLWLALARAIQLVAPPMSAALTALRRPGLSVAANLASSVLALAALPLLVAWGGLAGAGAQALLQAALVVGLLLWMLGHATAPAAAAAQRVEV